MSSPEASIEEILASIRKTFTDEPEAAGSKAAATVVESRPSGLPPFRSATETATAAAATPLPTPPRSRVAAIDDDLDDLIDKPASKPSTPSFIPQPSVPPPAAAMSPVDAAREKWANLLNPHGASNGSTAKVTEAKSEIVPQPVAPAPAAPAPAPSTGLFAPRKGGFYPPQDSRPEPTLPVPSAAPTPPPAAPIEKSAPATPPFGISAAPATEPATAATPPRPGFIPFPQPTLPAAPAPDPAPATLAQTASVAAASTASASAPLTEVPAASARALDDLVAELNNVAHVPSEPAAPAPVVQPEPLAAAPAVAAVPEPNSVTAPIGAPASAAFGTDTAAPASASRSFEDVVADMLRPLLEKWIDENMPRIVERALQRDAALGRKPGQ